MDFKSILMRELGGLCMIDNLVKQEADDQSIPSPQIIKKEQDTPKPSQPKKDKN
jgi:hypothetical protein